MQAFGYNQISVQVSGFIYTPEVIFILQLSVQNVE